MRRTTPGPPCPNRDCQPPHVVRNGHMSGQQRYRCLGCGAWFGETEGTPLYRLRTPPEESARALLLVMRRGRLRAAAEGSGHHYETLSQWLHLAARPAQALTPALGHDLQLSTREVAEFSSFARRQTALGPSPIRRRMGWPPR